MEGFSAALSDFLARYGLLALFVVMLLKEAGVPVPVPSDLVMISAGVQAAAGSYALPELAMAIEAAMWSGGSLQFMLARGAGRSFVYRFGRFVGLTPERLDRALALLQRRGPWAVFLGLNIPGARAGIIPAAGISGMRYPAFTPAMMAGSTVFYGWHIALGYLAGPSAMGLLEHLPGSVPLGPVLAGLALLGLIGWLVVRRRRGVGEAVLSWTEAACPACLALGALEAARSAAEHDHPPPRAA